MKPLKDMTPYELGESGDPQAFRYLIRFLQSEKYNEKRLAASALEKLNKKHNISILPAKLYLLKNCGNPKPQIRQYSLKALSRLSQHLTEMDVDTLKGYLHKEDKEYNISLLKQLIADFNKRSDKEDKENKIKPTPGQELGPKKPTIKWGAEELDPSKYSTVVILAKSRKYGGFCVAGKTIRGVYKGNWVRPVSNREHEELSLEQITCSDGNVAELLDIVSIPIIRSVPHGYQTENILINESKSWIKHGRFPDDQLADICDRPQSLWINRYHSKHGRNDRIPCDLALANIKTSLCLVQVSGFCVVVQSEFGKKRIRAEFTYNRVKYRLAITDYAVERYYKSKEIGSYSYSNKVIYLCISLGEVFEEYCYKLVAAVISNKK